MHGTTVGHYEILEKLGEGGMGVVYKARDVLLNRTAALKFLPVDSADAEEKRRRFVQEAQSTSALNHPNIITIYEVAQAGERDFIAMELVQGQPLDQMIGRTVAYMSPEQAEGQPVRSGTTCRPTYGAPRSIRRPGSLEPLSASPAGSTPAWVRRHRETANVSRIWEVLAAAVGLSIANGQMFYAAFELQSNVWLADRREPAARSRRLREARTSA